MTSSPSSNTSLTTSARSTYNNPNSIFVLTGDLNRLNTSELQTNWGLEQIVNIPTHNDNILDQFITNTPDQFVVQFAQSLVNTKHKALIINSKADWAQAVACPQRTTITIFDYTPLISCLLRQALVNFNWGGIIAVINCRTDSIDNIYNDFINIIKWHINSIVPVRKISMRERDPSYITPRIKILLRKRNKLRRAGKIEQADYIAVKVNP